MKCDLTVKDIHLQIWQHGMQRSSDQAAVHRMQKNSSNQCMTLQVVMGLSLPDWPKENREVLFPSVSCCLYGKSN